MTLLKTAVAALLVASALPADPLGVSYTVGGSPGDWALDFSVANNIAGAPNQSFYFFGVDLSATNITGSPVSFTPDFPFNPSPYGGPDETYNNVWLYDAPVATQLPGTTTSGFDVTISDSVAPTSVDWFAFTADTNLAPSYTGGGNFNGAFNPGFSGVASEVPEPSTLGLFGAALAGMIVLQILAHKIS
jgi:hypothetical protein